MTTEIMKPLYIFDLDGTLALCGHRLHFLDDRDDKNRWNKFYAACDKDRPNRPVITTMNTLALHSDIWIFTGRRETERDKTIAWLAQCTWLNFSYSGVNLVMRDDGDYTPDDKLKNGWLDNMLIDDRKRLVATFDGRDRVVEMWRDNGVTCLQVASGDF